MKKVLIAFLLCANALSATVYLEPTPQFKPRFEIVTVYLEHEGQILLLHRQDNTSQGNKWGIPGGKIENNESPKQAVIREFKEETGIDLSNHSLEALKPVYIEYDQKIHFVYHAFRTTLQTNPADVKINFNEHKGFTWVTPSDALKMNLLQDEDTCILKDYCLQ